MACSPQGGQVKKPTPNNVPSFAEHLNLKAVLNQSLQVNSISALEKSLNNPSGPNNLDLNGDQVVDYIRLEYYLTGTFHGISLLVDNGDGESEVATIEMEKTPQDKIRINLIGNPLIFESSISVTQSPENFPLWNNLLVQHEDYTSPYYYGYYPKGYIPFATVSQKTYKRHISATSMDVAVQKANPKSHSPNRGKTCRYLSEILAQNPEEETQPTKEARTSLNNH